jgi:hypothetical protein
VTENERRGEGNAAAHDGRVEVAGGDGDGPNEGLALAIEPRGGNVTPLELAGSNERQRLQPITSCERRFRLGGAPSYVNPDGAGHPAM